MPRALIRDKEERLVLDYGTARGGPKLILSQHRLGLAGTLAEELEHGPAEIVSPGLGHDVYRCPALASVFRIIQPGLHSKFFNRIGRGYRDARFVALVVPTKSYAANSAWQQLNVLAHNLCRSFQLDTIAETKGISRKRTCTHLLHTIRTIRFRIINKAGRLVRVSGRNALRMATN